MSFNSSNNSINNSDNNSNNSNNNILIGNNNIINNLNYTIPLLSNKGQQQKFHINIGKEYANCLIYYYSSQKQNDKLIMMDDNYQNVSNKGFKKLDDNGEGIIKLDCPKNYIDNQNSYMSHINIQVSGKNMTEWNSKSIIFPFMCNISKEILQNHIKNNDRLIINTLPKESYNKSHIEKSFNLYYKDASKLSITKIQTIIKDMISKYIQYNDYIKKNNIDFLDIPICVYGYNMNCMASYELGNILYKSGFTNIIDYKNGIVEWMSI